mgnify:CR=1 FL=1
MKQGRVAKFQRYTFDGLVDGSSLDRGYTQLGRRHAAPWRVLGQCSGPILSIRPEYLLEILSARGISEGF